MKYKNLTAVADAFKSGELSGYKLVLDNDDSFLDWDGKDNPHEPGTDAYWEFCDNKRDECRDWYRGNGYRDIDAACAAAGIPTEWV